MKQPLSNEERILISRVEAAKLLSVSEKHLWTLTQRGEIPFVKLGNRVLYSPDGLRRWVLEHEESGSESNGTGKSVMNDNVGFSMDSGLECQIEN